MHSILEYQDNNNTNNNHRPITTRSGSSITSICYTGRYCLPGLNRSPYVPRLGGFPLVPIRTLSGRDPAMIVLISTCPMSLVPPWSVRTWVCECVRPFLAWSHLAAVHRYMSRVRYLRRIMSLYIMALSWLLRLAGSRAVHEISPNSLPRGLIR